MFSFDSFRQCLQGPGQAIRFKQISPAAAEVAELNLYHLVLRNGYHRVIRWKVPEMLR